MKITCFLIITCLLQSKGEVNMEQKVSLKAKQITLEKVFEELRKQIDCDFLYNHTVIKKKGFIDLDFDSKSVGELLAEILNPLGMDYIVFNNAIIIKEFSEKTKQDHLEGHEITGIIRDEKGEFLPGVTIRLKGSNLGVISNTKGEFKIIVPDIQNNILIFSFIGMETKEVNLSGKTNLEVLMYPEDIEIGEVVVTGYQVIDKRALTSSIYTVDISELEKMGALTIDQMLEGKVPGLMITNLSAQPGAAPKVRVRSTGTFTGSREPLWVIDGVIYEDPVSLSASEINSLDNVNIIGNAITGINPHDIQTINILKDASATAVYGTRAANGVIVITTKRGKIGKPTLSYNGSLNIVDRPRYKNFNLMSSKERIEVSREIYERQLVFHRVWPGVTMLQNPMGYERAIFNYFEDGDYNRFQDEVSRLEKLNYNWFKEFYRPALNHSHSVNISGGTDNARYYFSLGYDDQIGTEKGVNLSRITGRSNLDIDLRKNILLSFGIDGSVQKAKYNHPNFNAFNEAYYTSRAVEARDENNNLVFYDKHILGTNNTAYENQFAKYNPTHERLNSRQIIQNKAFNFNVLIDWKIVNGIRLNSRFSYRNTTNLNEQWMKENTFAIAKLRSFDEYSQDLEERFYNYYSVVPFGGLYSAGQTTQENLNIKNQLLLTKVLNNNHVFNLDITQEANTTKYKGSSDWHSPGYLHDQGKRFTQLPYLYGDDHSVQIDSYIYKAMLKWFSGQIEGGYSIYPNVTDKTSNMLSWLGIFNYSFKNKYIFNFNIRSDGSNTFGQYERYKFRPSWSTSARWNIVEENFFNKLYFVNDLALKASYGFSGTSPNASPYLLLTDFGNKSSFYFPEKTSKLYKFPNANLKWEKTSTMNVGLDFSLFNNRLMGTAEYSYSKSTDLLLSRPVSMVNGVSSELYNAGSKDNHTIEFSFRSEILKLKDIKWNFNFNFTHLNENILKGNNLEVGKTNINNYLDGKILMKGFPIDGFYSYKFERLDEEGKPILAGFEGEYESLYNQLEDMLVYQGNRLPKIYGGFGTELGYKNLTLSTSFTYKTGYKVRLLELYQNGGFLPLPNESMNREFTKRWKKEGDENITNIPRLTDDVGEIKNINSFFLPSGKNSIYQLYDLTDLRTAKGDHIRWQTLTLSYNLRNQFLTQIGLSSATVRFQVQNLYVWSFDNKIRKNQDPEQVRNIGIPTLPSYNLGLYISF